MVEMQEKKEPKIYYSVFWKEQDQTRLIDWWKSLEESPGERAQLRRCRIPAEVFCQRGFHRLCNKLPWWAKWDEDVMALASAAGVLSHVRAESLLSFPAQLGREKDNSGKPVMSELRFQQLLACQNWDEFYVSLRRAVHLAGLTVNIISLADGVFHWAGDRKDVSSENPSKRFRFSWADSYYGTVFKYQ